MDFKSLPFPSFSNEVKKDAGFPTYIRVSAEFFLCKNEDLARKVDTCVLKLNTVMTVSAFAGALWRRNVNLSFAR